VNRLIRVSYGPFRLGTLKPGEVEEIKPRVLFDQLGLEAAIEGHAVAKEKSKRPLRKKPSPRRPDGQAPRRPR
jgi:23S rRNA pseudouridine2605 synthase